MKITKPKKFSSCAYICGKIFGKTPLAHFGIFCGFYLSQSYFFKFEEWSRGSPIASNASK